MGFTVDEITTPVAAVVVYVVCCAHQYFIGGGAFYQLERKWGLFLLSGKSPIGWFDRLIINSTYKKKNNPGLTRVDAGTLFPYPLLLPKSYGN